MDHSKKTMKKNEYILLLKFRLAVALNEVGIYENLIKELGADISVVDDEDEDISSEVAARTKRQHTNGVHLNKDGTPDKRFKENETEALHAARHMENGDDGRGEVQDEKTDLRLKENDRKKRIFASTN